MCQGSLSGMHGDVLPGIEQAVLYRTGFALKSASLGSTQTPTQNDETFQRFTPLQNLKLQASFLCSLRTVNLSTLPVIAKNVSWTVSYLRLCVHGMLMLARSHSFSGRSRDDTRPAR